MALATKEFAMKNRQKGFSLIELMTVVAIIGILAAMAFPAISRYVRNYQIEGGAQQVTSEVQLARTKAIMRNVNRAALFMVLPANPNTDPPNRYQWVLPDQTMIKVGDPKFPAGGFRNVGDLQADPSQAGPIRVLPQGLEFVAVGGNRGGVGFTRLGAQCDLAGGGCGAPLIDDTDAIMCPTCITFDGLNGRATVTIRQPSTGLQKTITVEAGGRVLAQ
jgi:prepilin-type N-terminal cleavage/methylation domain-containing protein